MRSNGQSVNERTLRGLLDVSEPPGCGEEPVRIFLRQQTKADELHSLEYEERSALPLRLRTRPIPRLSRRLGPLYVSEFAAIALLTFSTKLELLGRCLHGPVRLAVMDREGAGNYSPGSAHNFD